MEKHEAELRNANLSEQMEQLKEELVVKTTVASSVEQRVEQLEKDLAFQTKVAALVELHNVNLEEQVTQLEHSHRAVATNALYQSTMTAKLDEALHAVNLVPQ
jgi:hypothetical protein